MRPLAQELRPCRLRHMPDRLLPAHHQAAGWLAGSLSGEDAGQDFSLRGLSLSYCLIGACLAVRPLEWLVWPR